MFSFSKISSFFIPILILPFVFIPKVNSQSTSGVVEFEGSIDSNNYSCGLHSFELGTLKPVYGSDGIYMTSFSNGAEPATFLVDAIGEFNVAVNSFIVSTKSGSSYAQLDDDNAETFLSVSVTDATPSLASIDQFTDEEVDSFIVPASWTSDTTYYVHAAYKVPNFSPGISVSDVTYKFTISVECTPDS